MIGINLFHNELADNLTKEYGELIELGLFHEDIVRVLLERYEVELDDELEQMVFWLSLAKIQILLELSEEKPALHPEVRDNAMATIRRLIESYEPVYLEQKEDLDQIMGDLAARL